MVRFEEYQRPFIASVNCGSDHSAFVDEIGRLFMCGKGEHG
jgi:alpha-tubulin suppressor-like RCC1 family protein